MSHKISHTIKWFKEFNHVLPICLLYFTLSTFVKTYHITYLYCHKIVKMTSLNMRVLFPKEETIVEWTFMQYVKWMYIYLSLLLVGVPWMNELIRFVAKGTLGLRSHKIVPGFKRYRTSQFAETRTRLRCNKVLWKVKLNAVFDLLWEGTMLIIW